ncbi:type I DNA topoisomerase [Candidatus Synechococcus spongiarum]|uniref:DNA topoisomerase 1 n=2 Tax=Candidatus Synechococcus spongiarum TaxID=431041 RepID=A0A1T1D448_9SYNE|nr:type I DNA topoisomerase [Candidatus Synechococcus spongiarum]OOV35627.1 DNA topoisomerase I [Candidatus Synechococcus spongiarum LMB bulk15M]OOV36043.1 DNA topoisomerase I [Candidatus Synechococcus spongiarum LMB bulk15N]
MSKTLVIVESPTKAKTIRGFLPRGFQVNASMGHVRDLPNSASEIPASHKGKPWAKLGVNTADRFQRLYVVPKEKKKVVKELKAALATADQLLLATDEDREGESISWHLLELLKPKVPVKRLVFHEITQEAIDRALAHPRDLDQNLVQAQEVRRVLDRLVGYTLSPLLWKKVAYGLSAGRVQSVAVRLLVQRERSRLAFHSGSYWDLKARLEHRQQGFEARLTHVAGTRVATGADFDQNTGAVKAGLAVRLLEEQDAQALKEATAHQSWRVVQVQAKPAIRRPVAPFTTSTLQQEANRKLRLPARQTMRTAQNLYENGFITYMRTDSVHLSEQAVAAARHCVEEKFGADYLSPKVRRYTTRSRNAQEAHEAIRPAGERFRTPRETGLSGVELSLYELIWMRTVACQMADARLTLLTVQLEVGEARFRATGKRIDFAGFFRAYVEGSDDPGAALESKEVLLPTLKEGDCPICRAVEALDHQTQPPARFSEAALVQRLETEGVGRPSTYASIISTVCDRGYARLVANTLIPTFTAFAVTDLLEEHFPDLVDTGFTARMEGTLDEISQGQVQWLPYLEQFYRGDKGLEAEVAHQDQSIDSTTFRTVALEQLPCVVRIGKFGAYLETDQDGQSVKANLPSDVTPADLSPERVQELCQSRLAGPEALGVDPETGESVYLLNGQYGPYVQRGEATGDQPKPKRSSLPPGVQPESVTIAEALDLLRLPRLLGDHPQGGRVEAGLGRFGPYVVWQKGKGEREYRSLKGEDQLLTVTVERALELLAIPKLGRGKRAPLRELGPHPDDGEPVAVFSGAYGEYVKHGKLNCSLPEGKTAADVTMDEAVGLLAAKAEARGMARAARTTRKTTARAKTTATRKTTGKSAAKTTTKATTGTQATATTDKTSRATRARRAAKPLAP